MSIEETKEEEKKEHEEIKRRTDYENSQISISKAFEKLVEKEERIPTYEELAKATGLTKKTVYRHFKDYDFNVYKDKFRGLTEKIVMKAAQLAKKGNVKAIELYLKVIENWSEKKSLDLTTKGEKIDSVTFKLKK